MKIKKSFLFLLFCFVAAFESYSKDWTVNANFGLSIPIDRFNLNYEESASDSGNGNGFGANLTVYFVENESNLSILLGGDFARKSFDLESGGLSFDFSGNNILATFGLGGCVINNETTKLICSAVIGLNDFMANTELQGIDFDLLSVSFFVGGDVVFMKKIRNKIGLFVNTTLGYTFTGFGGIEATYQNNAESVVFDSITGLVVIPRIGITIFQK